MRVLIFVVSVPIAFTLTLLWCNENKFHAHELIYTSELTKYDTICISKETLDFKSDLNFTFKNDTFNVKSQDVTLLESIYGKNGLLQNPSFWGKVLNEDVIKVENIEKSQIRIIYRKGLAVNSISEQTEPSLLWAVLYNFVDPGNQHMTTTDKGRHWALVIALLGVILMNGLLVSTLISWIDRRKERWASGEIRYGFWSLLMKKEKKKRFSKDTVKLKT